MEKLERQWAADPINDDGGTTAQSATAQLRSYPDAHPHASKKAYLVEAFGPYEHCWGLSYHPVEVSFVCNNGLGISQNPGMWGNNRIWTFPVILCRYYVRYSYAYGSPGDWGVG